MNYKTLLIIFFTLFLLCRCSNNLDFISTGSFEAEEWIVPAEGEGKVASLNIIEGGVYEKGALLGHLDTTLLSIQKEQIVAQIAALIASIPNSDIQLNVLKEKVAILENELKRVSTLVESGSASVEMANAIKDKISVTNMEISALKATLNSNKESTLAKAKALQAQLKLLEEQINNCIIDNPESGTILAKYVKEHEFVKIGMPLYKISNTNKMIFTTWITGDYLSQISVGDSLSIIIDLPNNRDDRVEGVILSIAEKPQYTPSNVQTKENRIKQHYKVKVMVHNNGKIRSGMPGEANFHFL